MPFLPKTFSRGGYEVTVDRDRSIKVKEGDWLSKYSMAIWGDFDHIKNFSTMIDGRPAAVPNPDLIKTGDILYHMDPLPGEPPRPPCQARYVREFLRCIKQEFITSAWRVEMETGRGDPYMSSVFRLRFTKPGSSVLFKTRIWYKPWGETCDGSHLARMQEYGTILTLGGVPITPDFRHCQLLLMNFGRDLCYTGGGRPVSLVLFSPPGMFFNNEIALREIVKYFRFGTPGYRTWLFSALGVMILAPNPAHVVRDDAFAAGYGYMYVPRP